MILKLGAAMWQLRDSLSLLTIIALPDYRPAGRPREQQPWLASVLRRLAK